MHAKNLENIVYKKAFQSPVQTGFPDSVCLTIERNFYAVWLNTINDDKTEDHVVLALFSLWERDNAMEFSVMTGKKTLEEIKKMPHLKFSTAEVPAQPEKEAQCPTKQ